jgi:hypothetical protein
VAVPSHYATVKANLFIAMVPIIWVPGCTTKQAATDSFIIRVGSLLTKDSGKMINLMAGASFIEKDLVAILLQLLEVVCWQRP